LSAGRGTGASSLWEEESPRPVIRARAEGHGIDSARIPAALGASLHSYEGRLVASLMAIMPVTASPIASTTATMASVTVVRVVWVGCIV
jgi:hypothetical protein